MFSCLISINNGTLLFTKSKTSSNNGICIIFWFLYKKFLGVCSKEIKELESEVAGIKLTLDGIEDELKKNNVKTLVLDEAHHLRTEWYRTLDELIEKLSEDFPFADKSAKKRIAKLCEEKLDMKNNKNEFIKDRKADKITHKNARSFLEAGNKVKFTVRFRGRELNNVKAGEIVLNKFVEDLSDISTVEKKPFLEGKTMFVILSKKV